jgi:hypothetical protein
MPKCRNCKLYDLDAVKSKSGAVMGHRAARCLWVSTEVWPESVSRGLGASRPVAGWMEPNPIHKCQRFIPAQQTNSAAKSA